MGKNIPKESPPETKNGNGDKPSSNEEHYSSIRESNKGSKSNSKET
jgi:hypothetical protein